MNNKFEHQIDPESGRFLCNFESPMPKDAPKETRWVHENVTEDGEDYGKRGGVADGDYVKYKCKDCGFSWWQELPN